MSIEIQEGSSSSIEDNLGDTTSISTVSSRFASPKGSNVREGLHKELAELFSENVAAKIWRVAEKLLKSLNGNLTHYPETVPQSGEGAGVYELREKDFWTCGFFPGSLYAILERAMKFPQFLPIPADCKPMFQKDLLDLGRTWSEEIHNMAGRTDTHDMGFIVQPSLQMDWGLTGNERSLKSVILAAEALASRYDDRVGAIRSWDGTINKRYCYTDKEVDFLVIIDSMCNLDLLYYAGHHTSNQRLIDIATKHAHKVLETIVRDDFSTYHLLNFDPQTGKIKERLTNQGYKDWSTWSRGQAWGILGFTQTYLWTKDKVFLNAAISMTDYFLGRLKTSGVAYPFVPLWDFDAPNQENGLPLRDASAGLIAANGMLLLHQILKGEGESSRFLSSAIRIAKETTDLSLSEDRASFELVDDGKGGKRPHVEDGSFDAILKNSTVCNHEHSLRIYSDTGLVYADYFFLELGNKLVRMGLV